MGNRGQKRADTDDELPADKRACSSLESRPSTSISPVRTPASSDHEVHDEDMDTSSSASGSMRSEEEEMERDSVSQESERSYREHYGRRSSNDHSKFGQVLSSLTENSDESVQLASLSELCELLSFSMDISLSGLMADSFAPLLVKLARHQSNPDIMLLAIRALTYFCDAHPQAAAYLVRHDAVPALCQRLLAVEYLDVAEQCLRALEKISQEQPLACLESGAILAVLNFIDFFSTVLQRTALSTVVNICKKLPSESPSLFMEAVPNLCNLLQYEDQKLVESVATCLISIAERVCHSSDMLDGLCKHGLIQQVAHLIDLNSRASLSHQIYLGLIQLLAKLASGSVIAVRTLFDINISRTLKDLVSGYDLSHSMTSSATVNGQCIQVHEVLKLLNELLPAAVSVQDKHIASEKEAFLASQPDLLVRFGLDLLPVLIQVVNSGADLYVCYGCLSFINKLVYFCNSDMLLEILQSTNISSFLAGVFTRKDRHVLLLALQIVDTVLQKHSNAFMDSFTKEGVFFAVNALLSSHGCLQSMFHTLNSLQLSSAHNERLTSGDVSKCLCFAFDTDQSEPCKIDEASIKKLAEHIKANFFAADTMNPEKGLATVFHKLKTLAHTLTHMVTLNMENPTSDEREEELYPILQEIVSALNGKDQISTFEFVESGIVRSLLVYLSNGEYVGGNKCGVRGRSKLNVIEKRFGVLGSLLFSFSDPNSQDSPLSALIKRLQSSLASVETLPVILSQKSKLKSSRVVVPDTRIVSYPCLKVQFVKAQEELFLGDYVEDAVNVDPFSTLDAIEAYMWSKVTKKAEQAKSAMSAEEESSSSQSMCEDSVESKCIVERINEVQDEKSCLTLPEQGETSSACDKSTEFEDAHALITDEEPEKSATASTGCQQCTKDEESSHKLSFYLDGQELDHRLTLYQSIIQQQSKAEPDGILTSKLWNQRYKVMFRKSIVRKQTNVQGHDCSLLEKTTTSGQCSLFSDIFVSGLASLDNSSPTYDILSLLKCLEAINRFKFHLITRERTCSFVKGTVDTLDNWNLEAISVPQYEFVSSKMTGKLEQQMKDPMVVAVGAVPPWYSQLMGSSPFIFGYDVRRKYFRFAALGQQAFKSQSLQREEAETDQGRRQSIVSRKKFLVDRSKVLDSAVQMMNKNAYQKKAVLEVEYLEEVGTGLGPTLEFYTLVSREFQKRGLCLWREDHTATRSLEDDDSGVLVPTLGLFPRPWSPSVNASEDVTFPKVIEKYVLLGQIVGKALQDGRVLDLPFSKAFYKLILGKELTIYDIQLFDLELGRALLEFQALIERKKFLESFELESSVDMDLSYHKTRVEDLCLEFTLPGYQDYLPDSAFESKMVDLSNLEDFISFVIDSTIKTGISRQVEAFKSGLCQVFPVEHLRLFSEEEVELLLCGESEPWNSNELLDHIKFDHGFTATSAPILNFLQIMREFNPEQKRSFLRFVTGAPRLPHGGLASLNPKLTVVRKHCTGWGEEDLPSVMTCANYLKLPPYSSKEVMKEKLLYAIAEGQGSFHLS